MFKQYFIQTLAQIKQHRLISVITIVATALSIFMHVARICFCLFHNPYYFTSVL